MCFRIGNAGYPNLLCHLDEEAFVLENASNGEDTGHSYAPSLVWPVRSVVRVRSSFTRKLDVKNSIETLLKLPN